jgi:hypothetical protein
MFVAADTRSTMFVPGQKPQYDDSFHKIMRVAGCGMVACQTGQSLFGGQSAASLLPVHKLDGTAREIAEYAAVSFCAGARHYMVPGETSRFPAAGYASGSRVVLSASVNGEGYSLSFVPEPPETGRIYAIGTDWATSLVGLMRGDESVFREETACKLLSDCVSHMICLSPYMDGNVGVGGSVDVVKLTPGGAECLQGSFA